MVGAQVGVDDAGLVTIELCRPSAMTWPSPMTTTQSLIVADHVHVVLDEQDGQALVAQVAATWRTIVSASAGFTPAIGSSSMTSRGLGHQRPGHLEQLALAAGQLAGERRRACGSG